MNGLDRTEYIVMYAAEGDDPDKQLLYSQHLEALIPETLLTRIGRILVTDFDFNDIMTYSARLTSYFGLEYSVQMDMSHILWCAKNLRMFDNDMAENYLRKYAICCISDRPRDSKIDVLIRRY